MTLELAHFTGTGRYYRCSSLFPDVLLTDGTKYVADQCRAYWLMELIATMLYENDVKDLVFAKLKKTGATTCRIEITDDDPPQRTHLTTEELWTDFPEDITLFVNSEGEETIIYLPSEH